MYIQTQGYILRTSEWREGDRRHTIYTEDVGKVETQARGARKATAKLSGHLQPFRLLNLHLARGKVFYHIIGVQTVQSYAFQEVPHQFGYGYYILELVDRMTKSGQESADIFALLGDAFAALELLSQPEQYKQLRIAFLLKLLKSTGFSPEKRIARDGATQQALERCLDMPLKDGVITESDETLKTLFNISQYTLNEVVERPLQSVRYLQAL